MLTPDADKALQYCKDNKLDYCVFDTPRGKVVMTVDGFIKLKLGQSKLLFGGDKRESTRASKTNRRKQATTV